MEIRFEQDGQRGRYLVDMPDGSQSRLTYIRTRPNHIVADSTFVPVPYRGDGVAEAMVIRLFTDARAAGDTITPTCWYIADEFKRLSPAWDDLLER